MADYWGTVRHVLLAISKQCNLQPTVVVIQY